MELKRRSFLGSMLAAAVAPFIKAKEASPTPPKQKPLFYVQAENCPRCGDDHLQNVYWGEANASGSFQRQGIHQYCVKCPWSQTLKMDL